jgi:hypothetical protein
MHASVHTNIVAGRVVFSNILTKQLMINNGTYLNRALPTAGGQGSNTVTLSQITGGVYTPPSVFNQLNAFAILPPPANSVIGSYFFPNSSTNYGFLSVPIDSDFNLGTGDFTIEWFQYINTDTISPIVIFSDGIKQNSLSSLKFYIVKEQNDPTNMSVILSSSDELLFVASVQTVDILNSWVHFAVVAFSGYINVYKNGVPMGSPVQQVIDSTPISGNLYIGSSNGQAEQFTGNISNFRIVKGTAVYRTNFTIPTASLTAIPGTVLLLAINNAFVDVSGLNKMITNINVTYSNLSPF